MKLKLDENGHVVVSDGKPVYVHDDGKEVPFDAAGTVATIGRLNAEAKGNRERYETAEASLKQFEGITDAREAVRAIALVKNLDDKKLVDAGEVERVKAEATKALEQRYQPYVEKAERLELELHNEKIGGAFSRSKLIGDKFAIPADLVQAKFGSAFSLEDGRIVAKDPSGNKIYSRSSPGELAGFDEALEIIVDGYSHKEHILKGSGASGSGAHGSQSVGGKRTVTRAQFDALPQPEQLSLAQAAGKGEVSIVD
ncbi:hypothetical protein CG435_10815 [Pantoea ananatis]|uniref:DUF6651 domain-containing protein n=1 Tax=Pantoea ananas TaxID=553 RepID=UPI000CF3BAA4|nr:DUF6651 domain-containing protein [Pantoea ananatis]MDF7789589.1 hypothetical protein [Pantoea ananatis]PQK99589.1 hypothetical protein CG435_10815 [Pantoea ananatis]